MHTICTWRCWTLSLLQFELSTRKIAQTILRKHLGFTTSTINHASCNVKVDSLTFIYFPENYQTAEIYFYSYHVIPLNNTISSYFVN